MWQKVVMVVVAVVGAASPKASEGEPSLSEPLPDGNFLTILINPRNIWDFCPFSVQRHLPEEQTITHISLLR